MAEDRIALLEQHATLVAIDFVRVDVATQTTLWVFFGGEPDGVDKVAAIEPEAFVAGKPGAVSIVSTSPDSDRPEVPVTAFAWEDPTRFGRRCLRVQTAFPGDFSFYRLTLHDAPTGTIDPYYASVVFTFKAGCDSQLDCKPPPHVCPPDDEENVAVDYTARDWRSYRRALLEMVELRHPHWRDRLEADVGMMVLETLAAVADELTYTQDRFAREAHLQTATQRRSVRRHARLVDYEMHDGLAASTWLRVSAAADLDVPAGTTARPIGVDGDVVYEVGTSIRDMWERRTAGQPYEVRAARSELEIYRWSDDEVCLPAGSTELWLRGEQKDALGPFPRRLLLRIEPHDASKPIQQAWVVVDDGDMVVQTEDPLVPDPDDPSRGTPVTRVRWSEAWALQADLSLVEEDPDGVDPPRELRVHGNLLPVVAGQTTPAWHEGPEVFGIRREEEGWRAEAVTSGDLVVSPRHAVEREAARGTDEVRSSCGDGSERGPRPITFLHSLEDSDERALCWVLRDELAIGQPADPTRLARDQEPEVWLARVTPAGPEVWSWIRDPLGSPSADPTDEVFSLDDGLWQEVVRYWRDGPEPVRHVDYRTGQGHTVRFGDGSFGLAPPRGSTFELRFRLGSGTAGNLPADRSFELVDGGAVLSGVEASNPFPVTNGTEPETLWDVRNLAPEAWQAETYRAVTPEDYAEALTRLDDVTRASARIRWTGSWYAVFATPDPVGRVELTDELRDEAQDQLDRFRMAGRPAYVRDPVFAWLDLRLHICVDVTRYRGQVEADVRRALVSGGAAFFAPDRWSFGDVLHRSALEAAIHAVPGVASVTTIEVRRRGHFDWTALDPTGLSVEDNVVIGIADDPVHPERGSLEFHMDGGA